MHSALARTSEGAIRFRSAVRNEFTRTRIRLEAHYSDAQKRRSLLDWFSKEEFRHPVGPCRYVEWLVSVCRFSVATRSFDFHQRYVDGQPLQVFTRFGTAKEGKGRRRNS